MSFLDNLFTTIDEKRLAMIRQKEADKLKKQELKTIETEAYKQQKEIEDEIKWQEALKAAEERGVMKAKTTPSERLKVAVAEKKEAIKEKKAKLAATKIANISFQPSFVDTKQSSQVAAPVATHPQGIKGVIAVGQKKNMETLIGAPKNTALMLGTTKKDPPSLLSKRKI